MDGVEQLMQMSEVERMREVMDLVSDNMQIQNDKDRMEMLAMLASTTAMETNLMSLRFSRGEILKKKDTETKDEKEKALIKGREQAEKEKEENEKGFVKTKSNKQSKQNKVQPPPLPPNPFVMNTKQAIDKKNKLNSKGTIQPIQPISTV